MLNLCGTNRYYHERVGYLPGCQTRNGGEYPPVAMKMSSRIGFSILRVWRYLRKRTVANFQQDSRRASENVVTVSNCPQHNSNSAVRTEPHFAVTFLLSLSIDDS